MSKKEKLLQKLKKIPPPKDFKWDELLTLSKQFNFKNSCKGGSHYIFEHPSGFSFRLSKTHPGGILKAYQINEVKDAIEFIRGDYEE